MNALPKDPVMLLSFVNMQLRDNYSSLDEFCKSFMVDKNAINDKLGIIFMMKTAINLNREIEYIVLNLPLYSIFT